jgi:hypothetical protein
MRNSKIGGILLIAIGSVILLHNEGIAVFHGDVLRSFGFIVFGLLFLINGMANPSKRGIYLGSLLLLTGTYFLLGYLNILGISRGLNISALTLACGISFYSLYMLKRKRLAYLLYGNLISLIGLFFLLEHMGKLPSYLLVYGVDTYWPVLLIAIGLIVLANSFMRERNPE